MALADLLCSLESLTHRDRVRQMVELGRSRQDPAAANLLQQLAQGNFYERYLALHACYGSQNIALIIQKLNDSSRQLRTHALRLLVLFGDDAQVFSTLESLPVKQCGRLLSRLRKRHRQTVINRYLDRVAATDADRLIQILSCGSASFVADHLHLLLEKSNATDWIRLARRHPNLVAQTLEQHAEAATELNPRLIYYVNAVLPQLAEACSEQAVRLCQALLKTTSIAQLHLQPLVSRSSNEVADLVIQSDDRGSCDFNGVIKKLDFARLQTLIERGYLRYPQVWLDKLAPQIRAQLYDAYGDHWRNLNGVLSPAIVQTLPRAQRVQEAQLHLNLPLLQTRTSERLPYAAFLPWDEASSLLQPFIQNPDPDLRAIALRVLVETVRFNRDRASELLQKVVARRNEQDPIRGTILAAMADLPPGLWQLEHLSDLTQIIRDTLNAADLSQTTGSAAERFVIGVLPFHLLWAAEQLALLVITRGELSFNHLGDRLSDSQVRQIAPQLLPVFRDWEDRDRAEYLVAAAVCFGRRLKVFDHLVEILERIAQSDSWVSSGALQVLADYHPSRLQTLIPELISQDSSWIVNWVVQSYLHRYRQDLLTPFLELRVYCGQFTTRNTPFVLGVRDGFHRWTLTQQQIFSEALIAITQNWQYHTALCQAMRQLGALQTIAPNRLIQLADLNNTDLTVRDTALRVLAQRDNGDGIPVLLEAMDDDRARIAIYALRTAIFAMSPSQALTMLRKIPLEKVTVAKEVVRLIGELTTEAAYQELLLWNQRELHRDVRVALLRSLGLHLEQTETWEILQQAATSSDSALAIMVSHIPCNRISPSAQEKLLTLLATLMQHPNPLVRLEVLRRCLSLPFADSARQLQQPLLRRALHSPLPDESVAAAQAFFATYSGREPHIVAGAVEQILPNRQILQTFIHTLQNQAEWQGSQLLPVVESVLEMLAVDPLVSWLRLQLAIATLPTQELIDFLKQTIPTLIPETLWLVAQSMKQRTHRHDLQDLIAIETALSEQSDYRLRHLGLAALEAQVQISGWTDLQRSRLTHYQADPNPTISTVAQFIFPFKTLRYATSAPD